jgi:hypothetical protein
MENLAELMQRLLEIQSGGRQRSPELIAEDERLMDGLQKRNLAGRPPQGLAKIAQSRRDSRLNLPHEVMMQSRARPQVGKKLAEMLNEQVLDMFVTTDMAG